MQTSYIEYLETRGSNPHSLDPKSTALPIKLVSINYLRFGKVLESRFVDFESNWNQYVSA